MPRPARRRPPPPAPSNPAPRLPSQVTVMQQMNHVLSMRAQDGFFVDSINAGVNQRDPQDGGSLQHNLFFNVLLKRVVPLLPRRALAPSGPPPGPAATGLAASSAASGGQGGGSLSASGMLLPMSLPPPLIPPAIAGQPIFQLSMGGTSRQAPVGSGSFAR